MKHLLQQHPQSQNLPEEFWIALLHIFNHFFEPTLMSWSQDRDNEQLCQAMDSLRTLDVWLDQAREEGWLS